MSWHLRYSRGKPRRSSAKRPSDEGTVLPVIASNGVPYLQMRSVGPHSTSGWAKEEIEGKDRVGKNLQLSFYPPLCYNSLSSTAVSTYCKCHTSWRTFLFCVTII